MRKLILILVSLLVFGKSYAEQSETRPWTATLYGGIYLNNESAWQIEPSIAWHFHKFLGVSLGMELTSQYNQPGRSTIINGHEADLTENERNIHWIIFKPSVIFKSPEIWKSSDRYYSLWIQAEPGLSLGCPTRNSLTYEIKEFHGAIGQTVDYRRFANKGLRCVYWNARLSVNFAIDRYTVSAGYAISDLDYYSGRRNVTLANGSKFHVPEKELSQSLFLALGISF